MNNASGHVVGVEFDFVDYDTVLETVGEWVDDGRQEVIAITNPYSVLLCQRDEAFARATADGALTLPDGVGVILAARLLGYAHNGRVTGPTLMLRLCERGCERGWKHYFYGGREGVPQQLAQRLTTRFHGLQVVGTHSPPFRELTPEEDEDAVQRINAAQPHVLWVGLGAPKQEKWIHTHRDRIDATVMIGVGAAFDFHSGNVPWTPAWIRAIGMEWLFRLCLEPRRMWRRNMDSLVFLAKVLQQKRSRAKRSSTPAPSDR